MSSTPPSIETGRESDAVDQSGPFVGRWNRLVSSTNWEKGRIITEWRESLRDADAPPSDWSDEAWSRIVGGVTGQHAGRLRRVFQRFGAVCTGYKGLYWSHFHAAIDWDDAEMWLEGAVQSGWPVAKMQRERWSVLTPGETPPENEDAIAAELDEDFEPALGADPHSSHDGENGAVKSAGQGDDSDDDDNEASDEAGEDNADVDGAFAEANISPVKPFQNLAELPSDMLEAFESLKLSILRHKATNWTEIALGEVLAALDSLKTLASAPQ